MSYRLATTDTDAPGARVSSTICSFCSAVHLRRPGRSIAHVHPDLGVHQFPWWTPSRQDLSLYPPPPITNRPYTSPGCSYWLSRLDDSRRPAELVGVAQPGGHDLLEPVYGRFTERFDPPTGSTVNGTLNLTQRSNRLRQIERKTPPA
jgi:hypothetical protein